MSATRQTIHELLLPDGRSHDATVTRRRQSRHIRITVDDTGEVRVSAPRSASQREIDAALSARSEWIAELVAKADEWKGSTTVDVDRGGPARLLGRWQPVLVEQGGRRRGSFDGERITLHVPKGHESFDVLTWWYRSHAREVITARVDEHAQRLGLSYTALSIRDQRTRWGSCSSTGALSFNWRLVLAPLWVLDAIVVHELCHLVELNHSEQFWQLLDDAYPRHGEAQEWLRQYGALLRVTPPDAAAPEPSGHPAAQSSVDADDSLTLF